MKIIFIGCVESSLKFLEATYHNTNAEIIGIVTKTQSTFNSDHISLADFAKENNIDWIDYKTNDEMEGWISQKEPDLIYCFGWSHILPISILGIPKYGAIGYHPALLPANRGRHPIIWALVLGLETTGSTFFCLTEEADAGDILNQQIVTIKKNDDARTLYNRLLTVGENQVVELTNAYLGNTIQSINQDDKTANTWRKRTKKDGLIDWRMTTDSILRLVRALTKPYVGAHAVYQENDYIIWKAETVNSDLTKIKNIEPGKVIETSGQTFTVKTGDTLIKITEHEWSTIPQVGEYL
ncbi:formyltransferase family protein [Sporosarcina sp. FSL K6-2383]|uniref:methionyl-tRNA formyltransferase n=1 Tax=Sporosarcina sp. FSL K6-2383 TaxID=2921556 RepID=UPI00315B3447